MSAPCITLMNEALIPTTKIAAVRLLGPPRPPACGVAGRQECAAVPTADFQALCNNLSEPFGLRRWTLSFASID